METLENIDQQLFLLLNDCHSDWLDVVMWYISSTILWIPLFAFFLYYAFTKKGWQFALITLIACIICIALADLISVHLFKNVFMRYRPTHHLEIGHMVKTVMHNGHEYRGGMYGFLSSHAANYAAIGTFLFLMFRGFSKKWWMISIWVVLIGYSRIYLGVHYPSDVMAGILLGMLIGWAVYKLVYTFYLKKELPLNQK